MYTILAFIQNVTIWPLDASRKYHIYVSAINGWVVLILSGNALCTLFHKEEPQNVIHSIY